MSTIPSHAFAPGKDSFAAFSSLIGSSSVSFLTICRHSGKTHWDLADEKDACFTFRSGLSGICYPRTP